ncbi:MAG TPA: dipeptidase [Gemmatimonadaceae bacterium]|nr:dipeptidase [Gemmatimonadaceae bacterium]
MIPLSHRPDVLLMLIRLAIAVLLACAVFVPTSVTAQAADSDLARARRILRTTPLIDGHNDLAWRIRQDKSAPHDVDVYDLRGTTPGHTDLARMKEGMVGAQFWSVYIPGEIKDSGFARVQLEEIDIARRFIARYPERLAFATRASDIRRDFAQHEVASFLGMEGGHAIENSLGALRAYYDLGVRYMTLTHNVTLDWADAALDEPKHGGLTPFGKEVVREMNRLGMLVDLAHVSPGTMSAALDVSEAPVIFSHSGSRALVDHPRNVPDSILARVPKNGGIVMVPFVNSFVSATVRAHDVAEEQALKSAKAKFPSDTAAVEREMAAWRTAHPPVRASRSDVADHIEHVRDVAGIDHVGIGSDFDGIDDVIPGLENVSRFPYLLAELARRGWSDADLRKVAGENFIRVFTQAEIVAARSQKTRHPSTATITELDGKLHP